MVGGIVLGIGGGNYGYTPSPGELLFRHLEGEFASHTPYKQGEIRNQARVIKNYKDKMCVELSNPPKDWKYGACWDMNQSIRSSVWQLERTVTFGNGKRYTIKMNEKGNAQFYDGKGKLLLDGIEGGMFFGFLGRPPTDTIGFVIPRNDNTEKMWDELQYLSLFEKGVKMLFRPVQNRKLEISARVQWECGGRSGDCSYYNIEETRKKNAEREAWNAAPGIY